MGIAGSRGIAGLRVVVSAVLLGGMTASPAHALRANLRGDLTRLEELGHYEEALFYRRSTMDMILAIHVAWSGAPYDPAMDALFFETRTDRRYWNLANNQKRPITELLKKAKLTGEQAEKLDLRVRVYVEDHLSPELDEMGNFYFRRKAWVMERMGLFHEASFRRRLTGYYEDRVCGPYYATMAEELEQNGKKAISAAYRAKAEWFKAEALREFRRCNGDQVLAELQGGRTRQQLGKAQVVEILKGGVKSEQADARFAAAMSLAEFGQARLLEAVVNDPDADVRDVARRATQAVSPPAVGLKPGILAQYFSSPDQQSPIAQKALAAADIGFCGDERFPDKLRGAWEKDDVFPPGASGQFLVRLNGKLAIFEDGRYRFYVKTDGGNRAIVRLRAAGMDGAPIISPRNDKQLLYSVQSTFDGQVLTRVDFSPEIELKKGLIDIEIEYKGAEARGKYGTPGLRLGWSSESRVMEAVPASAFWHEGK